MQEHDLPISGRVPKQRDCGHSRVKAQPFRVRVMLNFETKPSGLRTNRRLPSAVAKPGRGAPPYEPHSLREYASATSRCWPGMAWA